MTYQELFTNVQPDGFTPYPYQSRLATSAEFPEILSVPTGVGKTAAVILSWIYRRRFAEATVKRATPRRLVYCLPMRTLVEQTQAAAKHWLEKLQFDNPDQDGISVHVLMGGSDDEKWYEHPERDAILIGTQDMLLSRALNRGYGMSRYQWPVQYALLNNDCLWVLDETQLMGVGLITSAQLQGLREKLNTYGTCQTLWMSATLDAQALDTVDHSRPESGWHTEILNDEDLQNANVQRLISARKPIQKSQVVNSKDNKKFDQQLAEEVVQHHKAGTLTLVVLNRVERAQQVFQKITKSVDEAVEVELIHSRFRSFDRDAVQQHALNEESIPDEGRILITTQAIEAGVDISSTTLFTELAPWSSLVQRFGRCNRRGRCGTDDAPPAQVFWIDIDTSNDRQAKELALPYEPDELDRARSVLESLEDVGPQSLEGMGPKEPEAVVHVIRRKDLIELFDTTPDLSGNDLDVSRYLRETDDNDVQVYWREWDVGKTPKEHEPPTPERDAFPAPARHELCSVSIIQFNKYLERLVKKDSTKNLAWVWNPLDGMWERCQRPRPGQTILLHQKSGGYDQALGWTGDLKHRIEPTPPKHDQSTMPAMDQEESGNALTVREHLEDVGTEAEKLRDSHSNWDESIPWNSIVTAAWWHDVGKAHPAFQGAMLNSNPELDAKELWAKSGRQNGYLKYLTDPEDTNSERRGYRHELASALAYLQQHEGEVGANLIAYLIAAHHGKVRLSIRSMPNEQKPPEKEQLYARGIWDGDELPELEIGNGETSQAVTLDLSLMQLGDSTNRQGDTWPSWLSRTLQLRDEHGPFRLAYLEMLVRIADWRGSAKGGQS